MTDTTTGATARAPEFRLASGLFQSFRDDLITDAFSYRPLPPVRTDGRLARWVPRSLRPRTAYLPHAVVVLLAVITAFVSVVNGGMGASGLPLLMGLMAAAPVLMTLVRPVGAFWAVVAVTLPLALLGNASMTWPWSPGTFFAHLVVVTVVALRSRPRVAGWLWLATVVVGSVLPLLIGRDAELGPMAFLSAVALLAVTVRNTRRQAEQEVTAQQEVTAVERDRRTLLEERTTIARELHDVVAHHMSVVAIQAEAAPYRVKNPPPELEAAFATIRENAVSALTELRRVLGVVRSADYEAPDAPQPTLASLDGLLANVRDAGLTVDSTVTGAVRELPQGVELSAYRIVQEALSNTLRHAPGAEAGVEVSYVLGGLGVRIVNGAPTGDVRPSPGAGHGITGMRERVAMLEGEMTAGPTAAGGYEVAVFIPVRRPEPAAGAVPDAGAATP
ncbi:sensor histidine kinase [Streptomyces subrutilus]|uniref:histidine kinase n=1 Tax=Streptomyces subrutilus TaxID=36818 RepID=A0A5P2UMF1_9ACTN|nr:histidine kinase [Streptomyces subrutilus]QEU79579.1 two-component sensor histidine kinase [Streptomyces subrutilus]WSJ31185.1 histidine kinase [Streptomyces subrutilus]GGZ85000.1 two-component sensor histidine kinase [Streptomyces subrutilus]